MSEIKYLFFDCMETLVDLTELPALREYALWGFAGSGVEEYWDSFEDFLELYKLAKREISSKLPEHKEYEMFERFEAISRMKMPGCEEKEIRRVAGKLYENYWKTYFSKCYVKDDVKAVLPELRKHYRLGVVSNFMVENGIEELLSSNGIIQYFDFVVTSVAEQWRKPHPNIYSAAFRKAGVMPCEIAFVGDDYINDYLTPKELGMKAIFLDRYRRYGHISERICDFYEIFQKINKI